MLRHRKEGVGNGVGRPADPDRDSSGITQHLKPKLLLKILEHTDTNSVLIFTRTKYRAKSLAKKIADKKYTVTSIHSNRSQAQRQAALKGFKDGTYHIMVATDIAARGLDIENISHVINFDIPATADDYIHRIGRTGRAEKTGDAFTLTTPEDDEMIRKLEKIIGDKIPRKKLEDFDYSSPKPQHIQRPPKAGNKGYKSKSRPGAAKSRKSKQ